MVLGHEFCGEVETCARESGRFKGGERVAVLPIVPCGRCEGCQVGPFHCRQYQFLGSRNDGGFAELCSVPEENLFRLPDAVDLRLGALVEPLAVGLHAVQRSGFISGGAAMVLGAGPIGLVIALWLKAFGARRVAVADVRPESLDLARRCGAEEVIDARQWTPSDLRPFDVVFEAAGSRLALHHAIEAACRQGTVAVVGRDTQDTALPLPLMERFMRKELTIRGCWGYDLRGEEPRLQRMIVTNQEALSALITREVALADAPAVIRQMLERRFYYCKVLVRI
jgi:threonine dehydrogenase-like Zn-dependent dehydrogenase